MKSIKLRKNNKKIVSSYSEGTFNETLIKLMDDVEEYMPLVDVDYSVASTIQLSDEALSRLESFKLTDGESYENIIIRMLLVAEGLNSMKG